MRMKAAGQPEAEGWAESRKAARVQFRVCLGHHALRNAITIALDSDVIENETPIRIMESCFAVFYLLDTGSKKCRCRLAPVIQDASV